MRVEERLSKIGITIPTPTTPVANYVPAVALEGLLYTAGQLPMADGRLRATGKVGSDAGQVPPQDARRMARLCAVNAMAAAKSVLGDLDRIRRVIKVVGFVASDPTFTGQPAVIDGASELFAEAFGDDGIHVRSAVGVAVLPLDAPVEVEVIFEIR
jgi:enamine deaminase RidA (YjgF/YER057c/UK114 family)